MCLKSLSCTFHFTIEMYRAPHGADDFGAGVTPPAVHSPACFGTACAETHDRSGGWRVAGPKTSRILIMPP